jgi:ApaG protein
MFYLESIKSNGIRIIITIVVSILSLAINYGFVQIVYVSKVSNLTIIQYLPEQSDPAGDLYTFAYSITITNTGTIAAQVISRSWSVNDANGLHEKIKGLGVVGYQPLLQPGEKFQYTSGTRLRTPTGTMHGSYFCVAEDGEKFDVDIPMFVLDALSSESGKRNLH